MMLSITLSRTNLLSNHNIHILEKTKPARVIKPQQDTESASGPEFKL